MFRKILFPTDFSEMSKKALPYVKQLKGAGAQEVIVLHVIDQRDIDVLAQEPVASMRVQQETENMVRGMLAEIDTELKQAGFSVSTVTKIGRPFREIIDLAAREKVSLIVLGSHGHSNFTEVLLGSTSENVIRHSKVPILVVSRETTVKLG